MRTAVLLILLALVVTGCRNTPGLGNQGAVSARAPCEFTVEFVSEPLDGMLAFPPWGLQGPRIAVGDVTRDGQPEVILAMGGWVPDSQEGASESLFYSHPVVFSWTGKTFEQLGTDWVGISSYSESRLVHLVQGLPNAVMVADVDQDGTDEIVVGTVPYRTAIQVRGAVYVFQWDDTRFVAEFSDYCMGAAIQLDPVGSNGAVAVSTVQRPVTVWDEYEAGGMCPQIPKGPEEPTTGIYLLRATGPNKYETQPLRLDNDSFTALVLASDHLSDTLFVRLSPWPSGVPTMTDWTSAHVVQLDGDVHDGRMGIEIENPILQIEAADLDGDGTDEIIVLAAKDWDGTGLVSKDQLVWQVFQKEKERYQMVYEGRTVYSGLYSFFAVGDVDSDGAAEMIESSGQVYKWTGDRLLPQVNLAKVLEEDLYYGLESIFIGNLFDDGQNSIIVTGRYSSQGEVCPDECPLRMIVVSVH